MSNPYEGFQELVAEVPALVQPVVIAVAAMVPYIEGEGAAAFGVIAGVHPVVAGLAAATGNILCVVVVVLLGARARESVVARSRRSSAAGSSDLLTADGGPVETPGTDDQGRPARTGRPRSKGRLRLERWMVRFGVPGASLLAPLALPTMLTAATFVASGVRKEWVILWQVVAIILWTAVVTAIATGILSVVTG